MSAKQRQFVDCGLEQGWRLIQRSRSEPSANLLMYAATFSPDGQHIAVVDGTALRIDPPNSPFGLVLTQSVLPVAAAMFAAECSAASFGVAAQNILNRQSSTCLGYAAG